MNEHYPKSSKSILTFIIIALPHTVGKESLRPTGHWEIFTNASPIPSSDKLLTNPELGNVWHGSQEPWHNWDILAGRFVSEFGM